MPAVGYLLSYIDNAEFILTDSFHGTAFSINFEKQVFVVYPEHHNTRLKSILQITECLHRVLTPDDIDIANIRPIDYIKVNETILKERKRSFEFLERACQSEVL